MIPADDRGCTLGDGLFETVLAQGGELVLFAEHLARLARGSAALGLPAPDEAACAEAARRAVAELGSPRAAVRLTWSAGSGGRGLDRPEPPQPRLTVTAAPAPKPGGGLRLVTASVRRNEGSPASRLKSLAYLDNVLARREAAPAEALMLNNRGELACAAAANLFWVQGVELFTPALECGVLDGVLRAALMARVPVHEVRADRAALDSADAIFLTNSLVGVREVEALDGRELPPHPHVARLAALVADLS